MRLARATHGDAAALAAILGGWVDETPWLPRVHTPDDDVAHLHAMIDRFEVTLGRADGAPQGFLVRDGEEIQSLFLAPGARGQGLGRRLLDRAKGRADRLALWCFQANAAARRFYAREGFAEVRYTDGSGNDEGVPDVRLIWEKTP